MQKVLIVQVSLVEVLSPGALFTTMRQSANGAGKVRGPLHPPQPLQGLHTEQCVPTRVREAQLVRQHYHAFGKQRSHDDLSLRGSADQPSVVSFNVHKR